MLRHQEQRIILDRLGRGEQLLRQIERGLIVSTREPVLPQAPHDREELRRLTDLPAQLARPVVGRFHFRSRKTDRAHQCFTYPSPRTMTFSGLMSRWMMPAA